jgi:hypothetical protein
MQHPAGNMSQGSVILLNDEYLRSGKTLATQNRNNFSETRMEMVFNPRFRWLIPGIMTLFRMVLARPMSP